MSELDAFTATWDALESTYLERLREAIDGAAGWRARFRAGTVLTLELAEENRREARFLLVDGLAAGAVGRSRQHAFGERLAELLDSARAELADPDSVPEATAGWILGLFFDRIYRRVVLAAEPDLPSQLPDLLYLGVSAYFGADAGLAALG
jgi:hypothetical protein